MSTFNTKETIMAGGKNLNLDRQLYRLSPEWELYTTVVNTMGLSGTFYESGNERQKRIRNLVSKCDHRFTAKLAIYARQQMNLRTVPLLLLIELADVHRGDSLVSKAVAKCIMRADEITELLACYQWRNRKDNLKGMSAQLLRGLRTAFNRFDEYQFAKYSYSYSPRDKQKKITMRDALFLVHPKAKDERQQEIFDRIARDELRAPYTWEHEKAELEKRHYSSYDDRLDAERDMWETMLDSGRLGYMALIRNLTRMYSLALSDEAFDKLCKQITDVDALRKSRMMPFRLFTAWNQLRKTFCGFPPPTRLLENGFFFPFSGSHRKHYLRVFRNSLYSYHESLVREISKYATWAKVRYRYDKLRSPFATELIKQLDAQCGLTPKEDYIYPVHRNRWCVVYRPKTRNVRVVKQRLKAENKLWQKDLKELQLTTRWINFDLDGKKIHRIMKAVDTAAQQAIDNIKGFDSNTRVLIAAAMTPAMRQPLNSGSDVTLTTISAHLAMSLAWKCDNVLLGRLTTKFTPFPLNRGERVCDDSVKATWRQSAAQEPVNALGVLQWMTKRREVKDKVILFTDGQLLIDEMFTKQWKKYKQLVNPDAKLYIFDLAGYGTTPVKPGSDDVYTIAGWNDSVFDILEKLEQGSNALKEIRDIRI